MTSSSRLAFQRHLLLVWWIRIVLVLSFLFFFRASSSLILLSDLVPTPAFLIDVGALNRRMQEDVWRPPSSTASSGKWNYTTSAANTLSVPLPLPLQVDERHALVATTKNFLVGHDSTDQDARLDEGIITDHPWTTARLAIPTEVWTRLPPGAFYLHATVVEARGAGVWGGMDRGLDDPPTPSHAVCRLDLPPSVGQELGGAHLVLGLNNHHVGSYYWARSAGFGAAMEAPGVRLIDGTTLEWDSGSPFVSNSNDGKRSEWVNFLRPGDQVQLQPENPLAQALHLLPCVYGVSTQGRPLGSEPVVVCRWTLQRTS